jgi:hypothetical protein
MHEGDHPALEFALCKAQQTQSVGRSFAKFIDFACIDSFSAGFGPTMERKPGLWNSIPLYAAHL